MNIVCFQVHGWRDMNQDDLTEAGMCQGVYDSDVFVLFLTNGFMLSNLLLFHFFLRDGEI